MRYPSGCSIKDRIAFITDGADGLVSGMESIRSGKLTETVDVSSIGIGQR